MRMKNQISSIFNAKISPDTPTHLQKCGKSSDFQAETILKNGFIWHMLIVPTGALMATWIQ